MWEISIKSSTEIRTHFIHIFYIVTCNTQKYEISTSNTFTCFHRKPFLINYISLSRNGRPYSRHLGPDHKGRPPKYVVISPFLPLVCLCSNLALPLPRPVDIASVPMQCYISNSLQIKLWKDLFMSSAKVTGI